MMDHAPQVAKAVEPGPTSKTTHQRVDDFALVIGINDYPAFRSLSGPVHDAAEFKAWLCDPTGGGLDPKRVFMVTSTPTPTPEQKHIDEALGQLIEAADQNQGGRRLYFYFSGHGAAATDAMENVALLLSDWSKKRARLGLSSRSYTNELVRYGLFEELAVFLDCCRSASTPIVGLDCTLTPEVTTAPTATRRLVAYATEAQRDAFELPDGALWSGVFTRCLLAILRRADTGVRAADLKDQLEREVTEAQKGQQAHVDNSLFPDSRFGRTGTVAKLHVTFVPATTGVVRLLDGSKRLVAEHDPANGPWSIALTEGHLYKLVHATTGRSQLVDFIGDCDVEL